MEKTIITTCVYTINAVQEKEDARNLPVSQSTKNLFFKPVPKSSIDKDKNMLSLKYSIDLKILMMLLSLWLLLKTGALS